MILEASLNLADNTIRKPFLMGQQGSMEITISFIEQVPRCVQLNQQWQTIVSRPIHNCRLLLAANPISLRP
jgi:hypothetical protein